MRLAIVENDALMLQSLRTLFSERTGITVVGAFASPQEALQSLKTTLPEIMIVDLGLPELSWLDLIHEAKRTMPGLDVMVHALFEETEKIMSAMRAGASGYFLKGTAADELIDAVQCLHTGQATMGPKVAQRFIREFDKRNASDPSGLTGKQRAVVNLAAEGRTSREIANQSGLTLHDVGTCIKSVYQKVHMRNWH